MNLPRFICTSKLASQLSQHVSSRGSFAWIGQLHTPKRRFTCNTQAPRFFSATGSSTPLLQIRTHSSPKTPSQAGAKRFYRGEKKPYKFPIGTLRQEAQEYQETQEPQGPQRPDVGKILIVGIIVTCCALFLWVCIEENNYRANPNHKSHKLLETYRRNFTLSPRNISEGRYWTVITSAFAHNSITHIAFNMLAFWSFAPGIVSFYGVRTLGIVYFGSAIAGSMAQLWWWNRTPSRYEKSAVGASGAIFGLTGFMAMSMPFQRVGLLFVPGVYIPIRIATAGMAAFSVVALREKWIPSLGHSAHLGGLMFGAVFWIVALRRGRGGPKMW